MKLWMMLAACLVVMLTPSIDIGDGNLPDALPDASIPGLTARRSGALLTGPEIRITRIPVGRLTKVE
jgi:hypothetical protein